MQSRSVAPPAFVAVFGLVALSGACAGAADPPPKPADTPSTTATATASAAPSVSASASVEPARAPELAPGRERISLALLAAKDTVVGATIDIPTTWGMKPNKYMGPMFHSCNDAMELFGPSTSVSAHACEKGEAPATCVDRLLAAKIASWKSGTVTDPDKPALRRWAEIELPGKEGEPAGREGLLYTYDAAHHAVAVCTRLALKGSDSGWALGKAICGTLTLLATPPTDDLPARDPKPDGTPGNAESVPHGEEMKGVVLAFHAAVTAGDAKAAKKHLMGSEMCDTLGTAKEKARCKADIASSAAAFDKALPGLQKSAKELDPERVYFLPLGGSASGRDIYMAYPIDKKTPCTMPTTMAWIVTWTPGGPKILVGAKAASEPKKK